MPGMRIVFAISIVVLVSAACSGGAGDKASTSTPPPTSSSAAGRAAAAPPPAQSKAGRNPATLKACEIVNGDQVAKVAVGRLAAPTGSSTNVCGYVLDVAEKTESYWLSIEPVEMVQTFFNVSSDADKGEKVDGPWDEAYIHPAVFGEGFTLSAIRRGDIAFEVKGDRKAVVLQISRLAGANLSK